MSVHSFFTSVLYISRNVVPWVKYVYHLWRLYITLTFTQYTYFIITYYVYVYVHDVHFRLHLRSYVSPIHLQQYSM